MTFFKTAFCAVCLCLAAATAEGATPPAPLSVADRADVARVEDYLNSIHTVAARFLQTTSDGNVAQGSFYLERPGKMRVQYDPPDPLFMVASGLYLSVYDPQLKQTSNLPIESTPAYFLLKDKIALDKDVTVSKVERGGDTLRLSVHETGHPDEGRLILVFSDKPLQLRKWTVFDRDGKQIEVSLIDAQFDGKLDPNLFKFVDPTPTKQ
ncbi:MAG TPA: outer membrane lipoprotein carrier protein LolA [Alphaproteobacteria bacterium]|nr:outer membrane lipoprotein carrier protein LolA [Alphaproteobacteria bacterium]